MADSTRDKKVELERYDRRAAAVLSSNMVDGLGPDGPEGTPIEIRLPYILYEDHIRRHSRPGVRILDLCCGNGQHSLVGARMGAEVTVSDIAPANVELTLVRARRAGLQLQGVVGDAETLSWADSTFDVVTCAGSLSYLDLNRFLSEVYRVLKPGGALIFVDSLNHNPVYRFNRWVHYVRGRRSKSTLLRMPTLTTLDIIRENLPDLQISYHGVLSFLAPLLRPLLGSTKAANWLDSTDRTLSPLRRFAFKIVGVGHKPAVAG